MQLASSFLFFFFKRQEIDKELYIFGECYYDFRVWVLLFFVFADDNDREVVVMLLTC